MALLGNFSVWMKQTSKGGSAAVASRSAVNVDFRNGVLLFILIRVNKIVWYSPVNSEAGM